MLDRQIDFNNYIIRPTTNEIARSGDNSLEESVRSWFPWVGISDVFLGNFYGVGAWQNQGWKIHVSATAKNAFEVFSRVAPILKEYNVRFKVVSSIQNLLEMNSGAFGITQLGKFITIYPSNSEEAVEIAQRLDKVTTGLYAPEIPTDNPFTLGSLVHYRYGSFIQPTSYDSSKEMIFDNHRRLTPDLRLPYYINPLPDGIDPFVEASVVKRKEKDNSPFLGRFLILRALHRSIWGRIYDAIDLYSEPPRRCIIKEFWHDVALDWFGRDSIDHAALESTVLKNNSSCSVLPRLYDLIESNRNIYLILEYIAGQTLNQIYDLEFREKPLPDTKSLLELGKTLAKSVLVLHENNIIHRDLKPSNIILCSPQEFKLIDLAFSYRPNVDLGLPIGLGTTGFYPPSVEEQKNPSFRVDIFGWGAIMHILATGDNASTMDDNGLEVAVKKRSVRKARRDLPKKICELIDNCISTDPSLRPQSMMDIIKIVDDCLSTKATKYKVSHNKNLEKKTDNFLFETEWRQFGLETAKYISENAEARGSGSAWPVNLNGVAKKRYLSNIYSGVAGTALFLAIAAKELSVENYATKAEEAARWLADGEWGHGSTECGLYSGESGVGLYYLRLADLINKPAYIDMALMRARRIMGVTPPTIDLVDGTAGLIVFLIELYKVIEDPKILGWAMNLGEELIQKSLTDENGGKYWEVPSIFPNGISHTYLGLLHGAAGIGWSLLNLGLLARDPTIQNISIQIGDFLLAQGKLIDIEGNQQMVWPRVLNNYSGIVSAHCHGAGGIGQFFVKLWKHSHDHRHLQAARDAADTIAARNPENATQCHGLAGDGMFFLDLFQATGDEKYKLLANKVARQLGDYNLRKIRGSWIIDQTGKSSFEYMLGSAGIGTFLLRLTSPGVMIDPLLT